MSTDLPIQMFNLRNARNNGKRGRNQTLPDGIALVLVRMPKAQKDHLRSAAKASFRTLTGEINKRLEVSMVNESIDEHGVIVVHSPTSLK